MKYGNRISPVYMELLLMLVLFSAASVVVAQLVSKAGQLSLESRDETQALTLLENRAEEIQADPASFCGEGAAVVQSTVGDYVITAEITPEKGETGCYYTISLTALRGEKVILQLHTGRYVPGGGA